jgi:hypothetical protein
MLPSSRLPVIACGLAVALSGCVAVPLAQMAASQMVPVASSQPLCAGSPGCMTKIAGNGLPDLSKNLSDAFHAVTGSASATHPGAANGATQ